MGGGSCNTPSKGSSDGGRSNAPSTPAVRRLGAHSLLPARPRLQDGAPDGGQSPRQLGAPRLPLLLRRQDHHTSLPRSLPIPPFVLTALRKVSGSPRRLLARGVRSPGPSGRGVGEGSLSSRGWATANFECARLGTRERGRPGPTDPTRHNQSPTGEGTRPRRGRSGHGAGTGAARAARAAGDPAPAPAAAWESIFLAFPRG